MSSFSKSLPGEALVIFPYGKRPTVREMLDYLEQIQSPYRVTILEHFKEMNSGIDFDSPDTKFEFMRRVPAQDATMIMLRFGGTSDEVV
jgi:hypothetical protein